jgi:hypothetical protein
MDRRAKRAQALLWEAQAMRAAGDLLGAAKKSRAMARLHETLASELLDGDDPKGWIHLFAAITAWVKAGQPRDYRRGVTLLVQGLERVLADYPKQHPLLQEISDLMAWMTRYQRGQTRDAQASSSHR